MFFLIVILVLSLMYGYVGWRLIIPASFGFAINFLLWGILILLFILPFIHVIARAKGVTGIWVDYIAWIAYFGFGFFTLMFAVLLTKDIIFLLLIGGVKIFQLSGYHPKPGAVAEALINPERRRLLTDFVNIGLLGVTATLMGYGMFQAMRKPAIVEIDVPIKNLPDNLEGFRIAQITDIHVSSTIRRGFVQTCVDMINQLKPDLIALTGDLPDGSVRQLRDDVAPLADLKAPYGLFYITGNHEYYSGVQQWLEETARLGFIVLINEHKIIEKGNSRLLLAGVTDFTGGQFRKDHVSDPFKAMAGAPECQAKILLAHQPKSIVAAAKAGYDYVISGHTHGGQYFPYHFLVALDQPYLFGFHTYENTQIYVSKGTGYWGPPLRIGARSEITIHRLVRA